MRIISRQFGVFLLCAAFGAGVSAEGQSPRKKPAAKKPGTAATAAVKPKAAATAVRNAGTASDKARFDEAVAAATPAAKAELLVKFLADFPKSPNKTRAQESLAGARAAMADEAFAAGDAERALKLFRLAIDAAPKPYSERLFNEIILTIPTNLYWRGSRAEAYEIARAIESNVSGDAKRLAALASFYLNIEDGTEAKRLAEAAIKLDAAGAAGYQALGMAHRLNFELEESEKAFAKALELDAGSNTAKRMLAEMKRAQGKSDEAATLYQEILAKDENDNAARTGYVLALFDAGKRADAEAELARAMERTPGNVFLLAGAAYWYAAAGDGAKAAELAQQAVAKEPRFIWSHIALARGLMAQGKPVEAEQTLVAARKYGNFPTLHYEIASARFAAGFYRDAAEELRRSFAADADGVRSKLGGRIERSAKNFTELVSFERRASIFAAAAADSAEAAEQMRALLEFDQAISTEKPNEAAALAAAERFANGSDEMATYRRLYAARALNEKRIAPEKALEFARSAIARVDTALNVANPASAVMASELYEARAAAFSNNDFLLIPEVPRQTLSAILRGRIEESTGLALLHSGNAAEAGVRFRRALSVLPKESAWWRSATWNLGRALEAEGKDQEALRAYIASYKTDRPDLARYLAINTLYKKVNGSADGLEAEIGPSPLDSALARTQPAAASDPAPAAQPAETITNTLAERPKPLPRTLPVADPNARPVEPPPADTKSAAVSPEGNKAPMDPAAEPKPAEVKQEQEKPAAVERPVEIPAENNQPEEKPAEEKRAEPLPAETKPAREAPADVKPAEKPLDENKNAPVETATEPKPVEERKVPQISPPPVEERRAEVKKEPAPENTDKPAEEPKPVREERKSEKKGTPVEVPVETPKENKPVTDAPAESRAPEPAAMAIRPEPRSEEAKPAPPKQRAVEPKPKTVVPVVEASRSEEPKPEGRPRFTVVKTDLAAPAPKPAAVKPPQQTTARNNNEANASKPVRDPSRPLFEPIVIKVPGSGDQPADREKPIKDASTAAADPTANGRVRVTDGIRRCSVGVSQEDIAITGADGTVAVLVSVDGGVNISSVRGIPNSDEIEVLREPRIAGIDDRIVYVMRSVTGRPGLYQVAFAAPCGRKTVNVRVR